MIARRASSGARAQIKRLGEVDGRRDENQALDSSGLAGLMQGAGGEQRQIAAHRRADDNLRSLALGAHDRQRLLEPPGNRPLFDSPVGAAMP